MMSGPFGEYVKKANRLAIYGAVPVFVALSILMSLSARISERKAAARLRALVLESEGQWEKLGEQDRLLRAVGVLDAMGPGLKEYDFQSHDFSMITHRLRMLIDMGGIGVYDRRGNYFLRGDVLLHAGSAESVLSLSKVLLHEGTHNVDSQQPGWGGEYYRDPVKNALSEINALRNEAVWLDSLRTAFQGSPRWDAIRAANPSTADVLYGVDGVRGYGERGTLGVEAVFRYRINRRPAYDWQYYRKKCDMDGARAVLERTRF